MGCGCAGSTKRAVIEQQAGVTKQDAAALLATGGPGTPSYTWNGPQTAPQKSKA